MTVSVARGTASRLRAAATPVLMVESTEMAATLAVLERFSSELADPPAATALEDAPPYVVGPIVTPRGPFVLFDAKDMSGSKKQAMAARLVELLEDAGIVDAVVTSPGPVRRWDREHQQAGWDLTVEIHYHWHHAVYLALIPPPDWRFGERPVPADALRSSLEWLRSKDDDLLALFEGPVQIPVSGDAAVEVAQGANGRAFLHLLGGDPASMAYGLGFTPFGDCLILAAGGRSLDPAMASSLTPELEDIARSCDSITYACIGVDTWDSFARREPLPWEWVRPGGFLPFPYSQGVCRSLSDEYVPDAFPWQILTAGHLDRLGPATFITHLNPKRAEVRFGALEDWWPTDEPSEPLSKARSLLAPLLIEEHDSGPFIERRRRERPDLHH